MRARPCAPQQNFCNVSGVFGYGAFSDLPSEAFSRNLQNLLSWEVPINRVEKADLAQTPVLAEPQQPAAASRNNDGLEMLETREWLDSLDYVLARGGPERAGRLLQQLSLHARRAAGVNLPFTATTPYQNPISFPHHAPFPGSQEMERRIQNFVRWHALAMGR